MKFAYYPGCSLHSTASDYAQSIAAVFNCLHIELEEIKDWTCCGASSAHVLNPFLSTLMPAKDIWQAQRMGLDILAPCAACYNRLRLAAYKLKEKEKLRRRVAQILKVDGLIKVKVRHISDVVINEYGLEQISHHLVKDLKGLPVVCYYGCLSARPQKIVAFDDPVDPQYLDRLVNTLGGKSLAWPLKTECCGGSFSISKKEMVLKLTYELLSWAKDQGAEAVVVDCPLCQFNLDSRQGEIERIYGRTFSLPIFYFTQLLGLGLGLGNKELGLEKMNVSPFPLLEERNILKR